MRRAARCVGGLVLQLSAEGGGSSAAWATQQLAAPGCALHRSLSTAGKVLEGNRLTLDVPTASALQSPGQGLGAAVQQASHANPELLCTTSPPSACASELFPVSTSDLLPWADACAAAEGQGRHVIHVFQSCAQGLEWVHTTTGLPWWASIPLSTLALRLLLLPISLRQAKVIRTNYVIYKEAVGLTDRQLGYSQAGEQAAGIVELRQTQGSSSEQTTSGRSTGDSAGRGVSSQSTSSGGSSISVQAVGETDSRPAVLAEVQRQQQQPSTSAPVTSGGAGPAAGLSAAQILHRSQAILHNFRMLRVKCDVPHPIWIIINPLIQIPCFVMMGVTLRTMGFSDWPGMHTEGALWFPDLTQVPLVMDTWEAPMGPVGFILPFTILGLTLTSLRLGVGAGGARLQRDHSHDNLGKLMRVLPPLLYTLAVLNLYVKVQQPHTALLHWLTSSGFTLGLQLGLQSPRLRQAFKVLTPQQVLQTLRTQLQARPQPAELQVAEGGPASSAAAAAPAAAPAAASVSAAFVAVPLYQESTLSLELVARVKGTDSPDILVIMGAQMSAKHKYAEAMYCLDQALALDAQHTRAHYSRGQVFSLVNRWPEAEACFRRASQLAQGRSSEQGQAEYCVATALHTQGKLQEAVEHYRAAAALWRGQTVVLYSLANALLELGQLVDARDVLQQAVQQDEGTPRSPFKSALQALRKRLDAAEKRRAGA